MGLTVIVMLGAVPEKFIPPLNCPVIVSEPVTGIVMVAELPKQMLVAPASTAVGRGLIIMLNGLAETPQPAAFWTLTLPL